MGWRDACNTHQHGQFGSLSFYFLKQWRDCLGNVLVCGLQQWTGFVQLSGSVVDSYPVKVLLPDLLLILGAVLAIGALATWASLRGLGTRYLQAAA